jgi:hypothetical protein
VACLRAPSAWAADTMACTTDMLARRSATPVTDIPLENQGRAGACRSHLIMRRIAVLVIGSACLLLSACGDTSLNAQSSVTVLPQASSSPTPMVTTAASGPWMPVEAAQAQAADLEAAEQDYAICYSDAGLNQGLVEDALPTSTSVVESCSTTGLPPALAQQIQELLVQA